MREKDRAAVADSERGALTHIRDLIFFSPFFGHFLSRPLTRAHGVCHGPDSKHNASALAALAPRDRLPAGIARPVGCVPALPAGGLWRVVGRRWAASFVPLPIRACSRPRATLPRRGRRAQDLGRAARARRAGARPRRCWRFTLWHRRSAHGSDPVQGQKRVVPIQRAGLGCHAGEAARF